MEILQLRYFYESAKTGSFSKTAETFRVPATSVSASVKRLEKELGCELFDRTCNRIILNNNGQRLLQSTEVIFRELGQAVHSLMPTELDNREIKMLVRTTRTRVTDAMIAYKTKHPQVTFRSVFDFDNRDFDRYDIIIDDEKNSYPGYDRFTLYTSRLRLRASANHPLQGRKLTLRQLEDQPFISIGEHNSMTQILIAACKQAGFVPNIAIQSNDLNCCERCLAAGVGIGLGRQFPGSIPSKVTPYLDVADFDVDQTICCFYKKESAYGNVQGFLDYLRTSL